MTRGQPSQSFLPEGRLWQATASRQEPCQLRHVLRSIVTSKKECQRNRCEIRQSQTPPRFRSGFTGFINLSFLDTNQIQDWGSFPQRHCQQNLPPQPPGCPLSEGRNPLRCNLGDQGRSTRQGCRCLGRAAAEPSLRRDNLVDKCLFHRANRLQELVHVLGSLLDLRVQRRHDGPGQARIDLGAAFA